MGLPQLLRHPLRRPPRQRERAAAQRTVPPRLDLARRLDHQALGFVIACFGDPDRYALRDETALPVASIQETAFTTALRFGIIPIPPASVPRHLRTFEAMGVMDRLAGDRAIGLGVAELAQPGRALAAMVAKGRHEDGADVLIMGCAGMADHRAALEHENGLPMVKPCLAGAAAALAQIALGLTHRGRPA
jgi:allantoin racemase